MINNTRPNYINPLAMMKNNKQVKPLGLESLDKAGEKKQNSLEAEKQSIQNSLLLMKGSSGNGETSEENIKLLEKKLDEITAEIKATRQEAIKNVPIDEKQAEEKSAVQGVFDTFQQKGYEESPGCYRVVNDNNKGYKIEYDELDGRN